MTGKTKKKKKSRRKSEKNTAEKMNQSLRDVNDIVADVPTHPAKFKWYHWLVVFLLFCFFLMILIIPLAGTVECKSEINCKVCEKTDYSSNHISRLPRYGRSGATPHDLGAYQMYHCVNSSCQMNIDMASQSTMSDGILPGYFDPKDYIASLTLYIVFAVFMCVIVVLFSICFGCCRLCGLCGACWPTEKTALLGYEDIVVKNKDGPDKIELGYSRRGKCFSRLFMLVFILFLIIWLGMGQIRGNQGMTTAMKTMTKSPSGLVDVITGTKVPMSNLIINIVGDSSVGLVRNINKTINDALNLTNVRDQLYCVINIIDGLPTVEVLITLVVDMLDAVANVFTVADELIPIAFDQIQTQSNATADQLLGLSIYLTQDIPAKLETIKSNVTEVQTTRRNLSYFALNLLDNTSGIPKILEDTSQIGSPFSDDAIPNNVTYKLGAWLMVNDGTPAIENNAHFVDLKNYLIMLLDGWKRTPNFTHTAILMENFNREIIEANNTHLIGNVLDSIDNAKSSFNLLIGTADHVNLTIRAITHGARNFNFSQLHFAVEQIDQAILSIPSFDNFKIELEKLKKIKNVYACMQIMVLEMRNLNDTVIGLPSEMDVIFQLESQLNSTLSPAISKIDDAIGQLDVFKEKKKELNMTQVKNDVNAMQTQVQNATNGLDTDLIVAQIKDSEDSTNVNFSVSTEMQDFQTKMMENLLNESLITLFKVYEKGKQQMITHIQNHLDGVTHVLNNFVGQCRLRPLITCTVDSDCTLPSAPDVCLAQSLCYGTVTPCKNDPECSSSVMCSIDPNRTKYLIGEITGFQKFDAAPDTTSIEGSLAIIDTAAQYDDTALVNGIQALDNAILSIKEDSAIQELKAMENGIRTFKISDVTDNIDNVKQSINDFGFSQIKTMVQDMNSSFDTVKENKKQVEDARILMDVLHHMVFVELGKWLNGLAKPTLERVRGESDHGYVNMVSQMMQVYDNMTQYMNHSLSTMPIFSGMSPLTNKVSEWENHNYYRVTDTVASSKLADKGSIYYLASVFAAFSSNRSIGGHPLLSHTENDLNQIFSNKANKKYSNNGVCLTDNCIDNWIDFVNNKPLKEVYTSMAGNGAEFPLMGAIGGFSRVDIIGLPFFFPLFVLILCLLASLLVCGATAQKIGGKLASCAGCCTFCQLPFIFLVVGITFPFVVILPGDFCLGMENVGFQYLTMSGDRFCAENGGIGTLQACTIVIQKEYNLNLTMNFEEMYASYIGSKCDIENDPTLKLIGSMNRSISTFPDIFVQAMLAGNRTGFKLKPGILTDLEGFGESIATQLSTFLGELEKEFNCETLHNIIGKVKSSVCCDVLTSLYWAVGSWYLIAFTLCCCGLPATTSARKRFPSYVYWGKAYKKKNKEREEKERTEKEKKKSKKHKKSKSNKKSREKDRKSAMRV